MTDTRTLRGARAELLAAVLNGEGWRAPFPQVGSGPVPGAVLMLFGRLGSIPARADEATSRGEAVRPR